MEYKVVKENSLDELEEEVNRCFNLGYDLIGGISIYVDNTLKDEVVNYCQAMVKSTI